MPKRTGTEIFHSNGQTETGAETEYITLPNSSTNVSLNSLSQKKKKKSLNSLAFNNLFVIRSQNFCNRKLEISS